ncbi:MAG: T9SS type A sorting domain-containing protein [Flavobacteriales bacterium]
MRVLIAFIISVFSLLQTSAQFTYFEENWPYEPWGQVSGGAQIELSEGGYVIACSPNEGNGFGFGILEIDVLSEIESMFYLNTGGLTENGISDTFITTSDGGSIYAGDEFLRQWAVKFDENYAIEWEYFFPYTDEEDEFFTSVIELNDGFLFSGYISAADGATENPVFLFKTSLQGDSLWFKEIDSQFLQLTTITDVVVLDNDHFLLEGTDRSINERFLMKVGSNGVLEDTESNLYFFNEQIPIQTGGDMIQSADGNEILAFAQTDEESWNGQGSSGNNYQFAIMEFDGENMEVINEITYPTFYEDHLIIDFLQTPDGGYAILGIHGNGLPRSFIKKVDANFQEEWMKYYEADITSEIVSFMYDFEISLDGGFICSGSTAGSNVLLEPQNIWLLKLDACGDREDLGCEFIDNVYEFESSQFSVYPNPASDRITVSLNSTLPLINHTQVLLRNTLGQEVFASQITAHEQVLDVSGLASGVYMLSLVSDGQVPMDIGIHSERVVVK